MAARGRIVRIIFDGMAILLVLSLIGGLFYYCVIGPGSLCRARQSASEDLIKSLSQAIQAYAWDHGAFPPGDGRGSAELVRCLSSSGSKRQAFYEFSPDMLAPDGSIINPVWGSKPAPQGVIHYRNNLVPGGVTDPPTRNAKGFDLWCAGCGYDPAKPPTACEVNSW